MFSANVKVYWVEKNKQKRDQYSSKHQYLSGWLNNEQSQDWEEQSIGRKTTWKIRISKISRMKKVKNIIFLESPRIVRITHRLREL